MRHTRLAAIGTSVIASLSAVALASCGSSGGGTFTSGALVTLNTISVPAAFTGQEDYSFFFDATFPHPPGTYQVAGGTLPTGMKLDSDTGELHGVPRVVGLFQFDLVARDGDDPAFPAGRDQTFAEDKKHFQVVVTKGAPNLLVQAIPAAQYRGSYSYQIDAAGGTTPYVFTDVSVVPDGLGLGMTVGPTGILGNFPTQKGAFHFTVRLSDADGNTDTQSYDLLVVVKPLIILTASPLPSGAALFPYSQQLKLASDGGGAPWTWKQVGPATAQPLPPGDTLLGNLDMEITTDGIVRNVFGSAGPKLNPPPPLPASAPYTFTFTVQVTDEATQLVTRQFTATMNPGPVLLSISPNRASTPGPFTATGSGFQPGATLTFKPGATQVVVVPNFGSSSSLSFANAPGAPAGSSGSTSVMVTNPDGGNFTLANAFVFPATNISFNTKGFFTSALSSTGLDCADVNGDGKADLVHCGASGLPIYSGGPTSTAGGLIYHQNLGGSPPTFGAVVLDGGNYYDVKFADVNADGKKDIVALGLSSVRVWLNGVSGNPLGTFSVGPTSATAATNFPGEMAIGRLDGDLLPDIAFSFPQHSASESPNGRVYTMLNIGGGAFSQLETANSMPIGYGVNSIACVDTDGNGISEVAAGTGLNISSGTAIRYSPTNGSGFFSSWSSPGGVISTPLYGCTTATFSGDFLGVNLQSIISCYSGSPNYSNARVLQLQSGSALGTQVTLSPPANSMKSGCAVDADFDAKLDWAITMAPSSILVFRGATQALVQTIDAASAALPILSAPLTGRVASGDLDGDGKPDLAVTTSSWFVNGMAAQYGSTYVLSQSGGYACSGNGGSMGIVFYLNTSN